MSSVRSRLPPPNILRRREMVSHQSHKLKVVGSIPTVRNQVLLLGVLELPNREGKSLTLSESFIPV